MTAPLQYSANTDVQTGNRPEDADYEFCHRMGIMTIDAQLRFSAVGGLKNLTPNNQWPFQTTGSGD
jgi:hypothetical protein